MKAEKRKLKTAQAQADSAWIHSSFTVNELWIQA